MINHHHHHPSPNNYHENNKIQRDLNALTETKNVGHQYKCCSLKQDIMVLERLCWTIRSWVREVVIHSRTVSPQGGDNYALKCSSENFPHRKYISPCVEISLTHTLIFHFSPILGGGSKNWGNCGTDLSHSFYTFHYLIPAIGDQQYITI